MSSKGIFLEVSIGAVSIIFPDASVSFTENDIFLGDRDTFLGEIGILSFEDFYLFVVFLDKSLCGCVLVVLISNLHTGHLEFKQTHLIILFLLKIWPQ